jgi:hypothetical protein
MPSTIEEKTSGMISMRSALTKARLSGNSSLPMAGHSRPTAQPMTRPASIWTGSEIRGMAQSAARDAWRDACHLRTSSTTASMSSRLL